jgi:hypothetical protein
MLNKGDLFVFPFYVRHLPPLRFRCVGGCWDRTQPVCSTVGDQDPDPDLLGSASFWKVGSQTTSVEKAESGTYGNQSRASARLRCALSYE